RHFRPARAGQASSAWEQIRRRMVVACCCSKLFWGPSVRPLNTLEVEREKIWSVEVDTKPFAFEVIFATVGFLPTHLHGRWIDELDLVVGNGGGRSQPGDGTHLGFLESQLR